MKCLAILGLPILLSACSQFAMHPPATSQKIHDDNSISTNNRTIQKDLVSKKNTLTRNPSQAMRYNKFSYQTPNYHQAITQKLLSEYSDWKGTRYLFGGTSKSGIDCSALLQHIFNSQFNLKIPRTTAQQHKLGQPISKNQLKAGDLIFFKTGSARRHVGIYVGDSKFLHASASKGVTITDINHQYWRAKYWKSKRVL